MIAYLCCDHCLMDGNPADPDDGLRQFEDGEVCPRCQGGHLHAIDPYRPYAEALFEFRKHAASKMNPIWRAKLAFRLGQMTAKYPDKTEEILTVQTALEASWQDDQRVEGAKDDVPPLR